LPSGHWAGLPLPAGRRSDTAFRGAYNLRPLLVLRIRLGHLRPRGREPGGGGRGDLPGGLTLFVGAQHDEPDGADKREYVFDTDSRTCCALFIGNPFMGKEPTATRVAAVRRAFGRRSAVAFRGIAASACERSARAEGSIPRSRRPSPGAWRLAPRSPPNSEPPVRVFQPSKCRRRGA
jgi:hypothetical protein